ncbi:MAG TPA: hypothetical protein VJS19_10205 [Candidatus Dormibacteraeota bacterium]|nr:hypothetical protein [Candidatus Dormibacteraeota bacterium]
MATAYIDRVDRTWMRVLTWFAIAALVAIDALYLSIINLQGGPDAPDVLTVPFVATFLALMAICLRASLLAPARVKLPLRAAASAGLVVMGMIGAFSIGLLILVVAGLSIAVTAGTPATRLGSIIAAGIASVAVVGILVIGFEISWHHIVCPATGSGGGTTAGFVSQTAYSCQNGVLTIP